MKPQASNHNKPVRLFTEKHVENLDTIFKHLYKDEILSDVTFYCKDGSVRAHKAILATSSAYFRRIFYEHPEPEAVYIMYGISIKQMRSLIELIYRGSTEVPSEVINSLYDMVDEMGVKGIICEENDNNRLISSTSSTHGRDTRFRGTKRVAVDFQEDELTRSKRNVTERRLSNTSSSCSERSKKNGFTSSEFSDAPTTPQRSLNKVNLPFTSHHYSLIEPKTEPQDGDNDRIEDTIENEVNEIARKTSWQLKQRKFKCQLCPSSFKRASHLSRHQLVHTGERPFPCTFCDKAFSRHDKLKNHIKKNHEENQEDGEIIDVDDSLYTIGHVQILTPSLNGTFEEDGEEPSNKITREDLEPKITITEPPEAKLFTPPPELPPAKEVPTTAENKVGGGFPVPQKKGRGRPRKYPPGSKPWQKDYKASILASSAQVIIPLTDITIPQQKRRGRPPKVVKKDQTLKEGKSIIKKRKYRNPVSLMEKLVNKVNKKRGPKPKINLKPEKQQKTETTAAETVLKKKRGRKPKLNLPKTEKTAEPDSFVVLQKQKKRGRPKKYPPVILKLKRNVEKKRISAIKEQIKDSNKKSNNSNIVPQKRGRGRPPIKQAPKPLFKRPRGRPRLNQQQGRNLNPFARQPVNILPKPGAPGRAQSNYDITNMPFGDLESLINDSDPSALMEPYVEINTEHQQTREEQEFTDASESEANESIHRTPASSFLENIGLSAVNPIGQIGQCTISLSSGCHTVDDRDN